jgi:filamentous hemagglutinin
LQAAGGALIGGLGGGSVFTGVGGALGAGLASKSALALNDIAQGVESETGSALLGNIAGNVVAGLGGALVGGMAGAATASNVESYNQQYDPLMPRKTLVPSSCTASAPCNESVAMAQINAAGENAQVASQNMQTAAPYIAGAIALPLVATIPGAPIFGIDGLLGSTAWASPVGIGAITGGVNATSQYIQTGSVNPVDVGYAALAGGVGASGKLLWNVAVNAVTGALDTYTNNKVSGKSDNVVTGSLVNAGAAAIGYGVGLGAQNSLPAKNWFIPNNLPTIGAGVAGAAGAEAGAAAINQAKK